MLMAKGFVVGVFAVALYLGYVLLSVLFAPMVSAH